MTKNGNFKELKKFLRIVCHQMGVLFDNGGSEISEFLKNLKERKNIFIINLLKQRLWLLEGQVLNYERLQNQMN